MNFEFFGPISSLIWNQCVDNSNDVAQKQSDLGLHCFSMPFWQALNVQNFRAFTIYKFQKCYAQYVLIRKNTIYERHKA